MKGICLILFLLQLRFFTWGASIRNVKMRYEDQKLESHVYEHQNLEDIYSNILTDSKVSVSNYPLNKKQDLKSKQEYIYTKEKPTPIHVPSTSLVSNSSSDATHSEDNRNSEFGVSTVEQTGLLNSVEDVNLGIVTPQLPSTKDSDAEINSQPDLESVKSGRIIDIFSRSNETSKCVTPKGEKGHCRSISQCLLSDTLNNYSLFLPYLCLLRGILVGVCCPDNPVIEIIDTTDNETTPNITEFKQPVEGCGSNVNTRIVGGSLSFPHEWSWMVALMRRDRFFCGGVIINDWYILTAAHCVLGLRVNDLKVRLGEYNFLEKQDHQRDLSVAEIKRHAMFVTLTFQHDIALLKLKRKIEYSKFVGSICLPPPESGDFTGVNATVVGWGAVSFGGAASPILRQVTIPVWDNHECDETYAIERITDAFVCAGAPENGEDACQGDSGGPLMSFNSDNRWEVIGLVSWGRRCGDPRYPGVYTRVTSYLDWIAENTK